MQNPRKPANRPANGHIDIAVQHELLYAAGGRDDARGAL